MPEIKFAKQNKNPIQVEANANLMFSLLEHDIPVASSCHGEGVCSKCRIQIIEGADQLSPISDQEKFLSERNKLKANERISCQVQVLGNITIDTGYW